MTRLSRVFGSTSDPAQLAPTKNLDGYPAWHRSLREQYVQMLLSNTFGNTFYVKSRDLVKQAVEVHDKMLAEDPAFAAKALVYARNKGFMRSQPIFGLAKLSVVDPALFRSIFSEVIRTPKDLLDFCVVVKQVRKGFGRALKTAISSWLRDKMSPYWVIKYGSLTVDKRSLRSVYRFARPRNDGVFNPLVHYLVKGPSEPLPEGQAYPDQLLAYEALKSAETPSAKAEAITAGRLPHEVATTFAGSDETVWNAIVPQMPIFALLRNLRTLIRHGVLEGHREHIEGVFTNADRVTKSKILPFQFTKAFEVLQGESAPGWVQDALRDAVEHSVGNMPELPGRTAVCLDISGSMQGEPLKIASLFSLALIRRSNNGRLILFDTVAEDFQYSKRDSILSQSARIKTRGATNISAPIWLLAGNRIRNQGYGWGYHAQRVARENGLQPTGGTSVPTDKVDNIIVLTDEVQNTGSSFFQALKHYKAHINKDVKTFVVNVSPHVTTQSTPPGETNIWYVFGWSPQVVKYISSALQGWGSFLDHVTS